MLHMYSAGSLRNKLRNSVLYLQMLVLAVAGIAPILNVGSANAEQLTSRKVTISTSKPAATGVNYDFQFSYAASTNVQGIILQFCSEALGACDLPGANGTTGYNATGNEMDVTGATRVSDTFASPLSTHVTSATGACSDPTSTMVCYTGTGSAAVGNNVTFGLTNVKNPGLPNDSSALRTNKTVYVRISLFTNSTFASTGGNPLHTGTVAASINQQLTVSGRVQERLNFCVAAVQDNGATDDLELPANVASCATPSATIGSVIDLGVIDNQSVAKSPVANNPPTSLGNGRYGIAMLNTNASNGTAITYFAEDDTTPGSTNQLKAFRVPGATCSATATALTDQCFISAAAGGETVTFGTERFGMNVPCIIQAGSGTLPASVAPTTGNLEVATSYNGDGTTTSAPDCEKSEAANNNKYAWNVTSSAVPIAASSTTGSKVVDNEIVKLDFGATAGATTPTGSYTVVSTYIATPTF